MTTLAWTEQGRHLFLLAFSSCEPEHARSEVSQLERSIQRRMDAKFYNVCNFSENGPLTPYKFGVLTGLLKTISEQEIVIPWDKLPNKLIPIFRQLLNQVEEIKQRCGHFVEEAFALASRQPSAELEQFVFGFRSMLKKQPLGFSHFMLNYNSAGPIYFVLLMLRDALPKFESARALYNFLLRLKLPIVCPGGWDRFQKTLQRIELKLREVGAPRKDKAPRVSAPGYFHPKISSTLVRSLRAMACSFAKVIDCSKFSKR